MLQRLALLVLGLLFLAGAVHGPMHQEGQDCGTFALCSGGLVTMMAAAVVGVSLWLQVIRIAHIRVVRLAAGRVPRRTLGRSPPR